MIGRIRTSGIATDNGKQTSGICCRFRTAMSWQNILNQWVFQKQVCVLSYRNRQFRYDRTIDLLIERNDKVINLCEMKYASAEFVIDKHYDEILRNKRGVFRSQTKTKKAIHITLITTYGVKHNEYWGHIQSEVTIVDLFVFWISLLHPSHLLLNLKSTIDCNA